RGRPEGRPFPSVQDAPRSIARRAVFPVITARTAIVIVIPRGTLVIVLAAVGALLAVLLGAAGRARHTTDRRADGRARASVAAAHIVADDSAGEAAEGRPAGGVAFDVAGAGAGGAQGARPDHSQECLGQHFALHFQFGRPQTERLAGRPVP